MFRRISKHSASHAKLLRRHGIPTATQNYPRLKFHTCVHMSGTFISWINFNMLRKFGGYIALESVSRIDSQIWARVLCAFSRKPISDIIAISQCIYTKWIRIKIENDCHNPTYPFRDSIRIGPIEIRKFNLITPSARCEHIFPSRQKTILLGCLVADIHCNRTMFSLAHTHTQTVHRVHVENGTRNDMKFEATEDTRLMAT